MRNTATVQSIKRILSSWRRANVGRFAFFVFWLVLVIFSPAVLFGILFQYIQILINKKSK